MKKLVMAALVLVMLCIPGAALADEYYDIISHDVHITVGENNVIDVVETLTLDYNQPRRGFYYELQTRGNLRRDIEPRWSKYNYRVFDFKVHGHEFELSREDDFLVARIGSPDSTVMGETQYVISYKCDIGADRIDAFDEFYWNLIYCNTYNTIESARFVIDMPKAFDTELTGVGLGRYGEADTSAVYWEKEGNTISGHVLRPIEGGEYLTARIQLPESYFVGARDPVANWTMAVYIVSGLCVLLAFLLWAAFGRDGRLFPTVEFYPPEGMTPAETGYVIDGCVDDKDVVSLILYWADKGYLEIVEKEKGQFELVKLKDLEDAKSFEKPMFSKLFASGDAVAVSSLKYTFYSTMDTTKTAVKNYFEGAKQRQLFTPQSKRARVAMGIITMIPIALTLFWAVFTDTNEWLFGIIFAVIGAALISMPVFLLARVAQKWRSTKKGSRIAQLIGSVVVLAAVLALYMVIMPVFNENIGFAVLLVTALSTVALLLLTIIMHKHTKQGKEWLAKIIGFKEFIDKAEKDRILVLVEQNPSYFYNVLPYAYVLGVTDKWAKKFEGIGVAPPTWYHGYYGVSAFSTIMFTSLISRSMTSFQTNMVSRPSSSGGGGGFSGGGFGGGGFSGGGGGGGGAGRSW